MIKLFSIASLTLLMCIGYSADAQRVINYKSSTYLSGFGSYANGKYARSLAASTNKTQSFGGVLGYLYKPSQDITFPISVGGEFGIQGLGAGTVDNRTLTGEFRTSNTAYWLNAVTRYRPIYWTNLINPYLDLSVGPKIISTGIYEQFNAEEYSRIDGKTSVTLNTTVGGGLGIKIPNNDGRTIYFDIGVYYQQTTSTKIVERNTVTLFTDNTIDYRLQVTPLNNAQLRFGVTWFR